MKISYEFATGETTEVEVADAIGAVVIDSRRTEDSAERKHRRHCYSLEGLLMKARSMAQETSQTLFAMMRNFAIRKSVMLFPI